jgi:hypothetical protein
MRVHLPTAVTGLLLAGLVSAQAAEAVQPRALAEPSRTVAAGSDLSVVANVVVRRNTVVVRRPPVRARVTTRVVRPSGTVVRRTTTVRPSGTVVRKKTVVRR